MTEITPWEAANNYNGSTDSERYLTYLAKRTFLSLWSYPNTFVDKGRVNGKGDGKELCDLLVVFGKNIIIFSDKHCAYPTHPDEVVAWKRWYKSAIDKSVKQLIGAERTLNNLAERIYLDKLCTVPFPLRLPDPGEARIFLVAVTRGSYEACKEYWNHQSTGSLILDTELMGAKAHDVPFKIGWPAGRERFVHVLDELTLNVLLRELDTVTDFIDYLDAKETLLSTPGVEFMVCGEEDLFVQYALNVQEAKHKFPDIPDGATHVSFMEGEWANYLNSPQRAAKKNADKESYLWDDLIEYHSNFIRSGKATSPDLENTDPHQHEFVMRAMAEESRLSRRMLAQSLWYVMNNNPGHSASRVSHSGSNPKRGYVFLTLTNFYNQEYGTYREFRSTILTKYLIGSRLRLAEATEAIGIATEPASAVNSSQDFIYMKFDEPLTDELRAEIRAEMDAIGILREDTKIIKGSVYEYPVAFEGRQPKESIPRPQIDPPLMGLNRKQRRRLASMKRRDKD